MTLASIWLLLAAWIGFGISSGFFDPVVALVQRHGWGSNALGPLLWLYVAAGMLVVRTFLWVRYTPADAARFEDAPSITVVIPAFNEGAMVARSIESCAAARYPKERLEILVIDDGSTDDTWVHICKAANRHPDLVKTVRFAVNQGKREALAVGFDRAGGEIVVTVDSDSLIEPGALLAIAGPFRDPRIGAVGGKVLVFNRFAGLLPRMLHVRFVLTFDFLRAAQSVYRTVYCCPGALSAYRASVLRRILPRWREQTFLGAPCTIGEDRALTNDVLAAGFDTVYQRSAIVETIVPHTYRKLCRMFLRWDRSDIREELRMARVVWRRPPLFRLLTIVDMTLSNLRYPVAYAVLAMTVVVVYQDPWTLVRVLEAIGIASLFYTLYYLRSERSWEFVFGVVYAYFSSFALVWIFPYALLTVRNRAWLTR
ncbi:MAG TPA: glycosyltransferase [Burkholderiaceae bacterium]|nr:glycosyltransferase [Burkholderiaceae bacterium]